jgi:hypothetical protein
MVMDERPRLAPLIVALLTSRPPRDDAGTQRSRRLVSTLLSLVPRPDADERERVRACVARLATVLGPSRVADEIVPVVREHCTQRFRERRLQAALLVETLAPLCDARTLVDGAVPGLMAMSSPASEASPAVRGAAVRALGTALAAAAGETRIRANSAISANFGNSGLAHSASEKFAWSDDTLFGLQGLLLECLAEGGALPDQAAAQLLPRLVAMQHDAGLLFGPSGLLHALLARLERTVARARAVAAATGPAAAGEAAAVAGGRSGGHRPRGGGLPSAPLAGRPPRRSRRERCFRRGGACGGARSLRPPRRRGRGH